MSTATALHEVVSVKPTHINLNVRDTTILKGLAISAIVLHNYFHLLSPVRENEFDFDPSRFHALLATVWHPSLSIQALFSFFGHFGVQIFIFLSAYGLSRSHWDDSSSWPAFMWHRAAKLYPTFGLVMLPWIKAMGLQLVYMLIGISNILPGYGLPLVGPWWFIPFIIQSYALWPLLRRLTIKWGWQGLLLLSPCCLALTYTLNPMLARWQINLLETPVGHMPELCMGIIAARYPLRISTRLAVLASAVVVMGSLYSPAWLFTYSAALIVALWMYAKTRDTLRHLGFLEQLGRYSLLIFLLNAIVRSLFLGLPHSPSSQLVWGCISAAVSFIVAALITELQAQAATSFRGLFPSRLLP